MNAPLPSDLFPPCRDDGVVSDAAARDPERAPEFLPTKLESESGEASLARTTDYQLGNPELPIWEYRERIVDAVNNSQATVVTAETGAGKSTRLPQFLAEEGYDVIVTQPRVVAARSVAERVREEVTAKYGDDFKDFVGYRTARERNDSDENQILFVTDGLQLVRELAGRGVGRKQVLVLDEVHEWNENMEVLVAWAKRRISEDPNFKVVVMSATMEAGKLSEYFAEGKREVPVIEVPGRTFDVKKSEGGDVAHEAIQFAQAGKNTLVFVPGKDEISLVMGEIGRANIPGATVLPLHGQLSAEEQRRVFAKYPGAKVIVATNVAQTSITIDDIDAVVDSGMERRVEVRGGVEGLFLNPISQADCLQRAGRAGRTKEGEYVLAQLAMRNGNAPFVKLADREAYGTPEIMRTRLDGMVLRLAKAGFDASELEFYHQPNHADIFAAKARLQKLGALAEDGHITKVGRDMERMPVESHYARMMIEARKYGPEVQAQLAAMLAVEEADGILQFLKSPYEGTEKWRTMLGNDQDSDVIKQLEVYIAATKMSDSQRRDSNIFVKAYKNARDIEKQLRRIERLDDEALMAPAPEQREQLVRCIIAGMVDNLYTSDSTTRSSYYRNAQGEYRETGNRTLIRSGKMLVGTPFDLQIVTRRGPTTLHLIESATNVPSIDVLREVAPQLFTEKLEGLLTDSSGKVMERWQHFFNGQNTGSFELKPSKPSPERTNYLIEQLAYNEAHHYTYAELNRAIATLQHRTVEPLVRITPDDVRGMLEVALPLSVDTLKEAKSHLPPVELEDLVSARLQEEIKQASPDAYMGMNLIYSNGRPQVERINADEILKLPPEARTLPDGREIYGTLAESGYYTYPQALQSLQRRAAEIVERQAAETAAKAERLIDMVVQGIMTGQSMDQPTLDAYGVTPEQLDQAQNRANGMIASRQAAEEERRRIEHEAEESRKTLKMRNEDLYDLTRFDDLERMPDELGERVFEVRNMLDRLQDDTWSTPVMQHGHLDMLEQKIHAIVKDVETWRRQSTIASAVPEDMIAALKAKFNS